MTSDNERLLAHGSCSAFVSMVIIIVSAAVKYCVTVTWWLSAAADLGCLRLRHANAVGALPLHRSVVGVV
ncbi:UNVERIFIED_CONTAM: hypothetical protein NY603_34595, partial [Bacteroidetes bacterium 56_B9]